MSKKNILLAITSGLWLIHQEYVHASAGLVSRVLNGLPAYDSADENEEVAFKGSHSIAYTGAVSYGSKYNPFEGATPGSIAIIGMSGPIMKYDNCGDPGTQTYSRIINAAKANPNIVAAIIVADSPGGTVDGTVDLASAVKALNKLKPVVTFVDGLMASAMYWVGSEGSEIIANNATATIGSIGTMIAFADVQPKMEKDGYVFHYITADASSDKNKEFLDTRQGNYDALKLKLNSINDEFLSSVKDNRKGKLDLKNENVLTGKTYLADDALANGLIDHIGSFDFAIERARALAGGEKPTTKAGTPNTKAPTQKPQTNDKMKKVTLMVASMSAIIAMAGVTPESGKDSVEVEMTDELLGQINSAIADGATAKTDLSAALEKVTAAETAGTEKDTLITSLKSDNRILTAKNSKLEASESTSAVKEKADDLGGEKKEDYLSEVDEQLAKQRAAFSTDFK